MIKNIKFGPPGSGRKFGPPGGGFLYDGPPCGGSKNELFYGPPGGGH